jgi:hypothetical protein
MKTILIVVYGLAVALVFVCGWLYPTLAGWSHLAGAGCALYAILSLIVAGRPIADAGKIAAWCWHGLSTLGTIGLLLAYAFRQEGIWLLGATALAFFAIVVTLAFCLVLRPGAGVVDAK